VPLKQDAAFYIFPNTPNDSTLTLARYDSRQGQVDYSSESVDEFDEANRLLRHDSPRPNTEEHHHPSPSVLHQIKRRIIKIWIAVRNFMTAPLWAALFSLVVAFIDPLKHALEHHMQPLNRAINTAGKCAIPLTLVVLGAYFHDPPPEEDDGGDDQPESTWQSILSTLRRTSKNTSKAKKQPRPGETKTVVLAILSRMILTPLLLVPFLMLAARYDWHAIFEE
jgi:predicted permease